MNNRLLADRSRRFKTEKEAMDMVREYLTEMHRTHKTDYEVCVFFYYCNE